MIVFLRLLEIHIKELIRDPGVLFWGLGFPVLMALGLGLAFSSKPENVRPLALVVTENAQVASLPITKNQLDTFALDGRQIERFEVKVETQSIGSNRLIFYLATQEEATLLLKRGMVLATITLSSCPNSNCLLNYQFDSRNSDAQLTYLIARSVLENKPDMISGDQVKIFEVPGTRYVDFLLPGLIAMGIMMSCMWGISYGLIERRSKKLLRRLVATPMKKSYYLFSMMLVRIVFGIFESGVLITAGYLFFDFKVQGDWISLLLLFAASHWAFAGLSILTASRTTTIEIGTGIINAVTTPMLVLSGIFFSYQHFPEWARAIIEVLPLTIVTDSLRHLMLEGGTLAMIKIPFLLLLVIGSVCFSFGMKIFKWY